MLAQHRLMYNFSEVGVFINRRGGIGHGRTGDPHPMHFTFPAYFRLSNSWDIVFGLTSHNAITATGTSIQVNGHCPMVAVVFVVVVKGQKVVLHKCPILISGQWVLFVIREICFLNYRTLHRIQVMMFLGSYQLLHFTGSF